MLYGVRAKVAIRHQRLLLWVKRLKNISLGIHLGLVVVIGVETLHVELQSVVLLHPCLRFL